MYLENLVFDAVEPQRPGRFWEAVVDGERLTDEPAGFETRLAVEGGPALDLCFQRVPQQAAGPVRVHLDLLGADGPARTADRLLGLGARPDGAGGDRDDRVLLADPGGYPFRVVAEPAAYPDTGPLVAIGLDGADPEVDAGFWSWLTGWVAVPGPAASRSLRHPSARGPVLELRPETVAKGPEKNRVHLDVRLEAGDDPDELAAGIERRGGRELDLGFGELPWRHFADPSGNELCLLPSRS